MKKLIYILFIILLLQVSCTVTKYVEKEVPVIQYKEIYKDKYIHDSVHIKDSTLLYMNGDTVYKYVYKDRFIYKLKIDTIVRRDSIPYPIKIKEVEIKYEHKLYWWQKTLITLGIGTLILIIFKYLKNKFIL